MRRLEKIIVSCIVLLNIVILYYFANFIIGTTYSFETNALFLEGTYINTNFQHFVVSCYNIACIALSAIFTRELLLKRKFILGNLLNIIAGMHNVLLYVSFLQVEERFLDSAFEFSNIALKRNWTSSELFNRGMCLLNDNNIQLKDPRPMEMLVDDAENSMQKLNDLCVTFVEAYYRVKAEAILATNNIVAQAAQQPVAQTSGKTYVAFIAGFAILVFVGFVSYKLGVSFRSGIPTTTLSNSEFAQGVFHVLKTPEAKKLIEVAATKLVADKFDQFEEILRPFAMVLASHDPQTREIFVKQLFKVAGLPVTSELAARLAAAQPTR